MMQQIMIMSASEIAQKKFEVLKAEIVNVESILKQRPLVYISRDSDKRDYPITYRY